MECGLTNLQTAGRMQNMRESIYEALQEIPEAVSKAQRYLGIYHHTKAYRLSAKTATLFSAVLSALEQIIVFMTESGGRKFESCENRLISIPDIKIRAIPQNSCVWGEIFSSGYRQY